jgi:hypothetical protein
VLVAVSLGSKFNGIIARESPGSSIQTVIILTLGLAVLSNLGYSPQSEGNAERRRSDVCIFFSFLECLFLVLQFR